MKPTPAPSETSSSAWRWFGRFLGPAMASAVWFIPSALHRLPGLGHRPASGAAVALLMACWWFTEAVPIAVTACVPLVAYPLLDITGAGWPVDLRLVAESYSDAYLFLFFGGMALGAALEHWNLHRRLALHVLHRIGSRPRRLLLGMLLATAAVSMWISNTATTVMMMPIALALLQHLEERRGRRFEHFGAALMLSVAYAASVGGIGTKIGTATNSIFAGLLADRLNIEIGFLRYFILCMPFVVIFLPIVWAALWWLGRRDAGDVGEEPDFIEQQLRAMGSLSRQERATLGVFAWAALMWVLGDPLRALLAPYFALHWALHLQAKHYEGAVAMLAALMLLLSGLLPWRKLRNIPWVTLVLLGGSFALANGIEASGLSHWTAAQVAGLATFPPWGQLLVATGTTIFLSAIASNVATINVMFNVLPASVPLLFASSIAASCDFALPAGTPPNAIVFGSRRIRLPTMMKVGALLDVTAAVVLTLYGLSYLWWMT